MHGMWEVNDGRLAAALWRLKQSVGMLFSPLSFSNLQVMDMWCMCTFLARKKCYIMLLSSVAAVKDEGSICHHSGEETDRLYAADRLYRVCDSVCACTRARVCVCVHAFAWTKDTTKGQQCLSLRNAPVM